MINLVKSIKNYLVQFLLFSLITPTFLFAQEAVVITDKLNVNYMNELKSHIRTEFKILVDYIIDSDNLTINEGNTQSASAKYTDEEFYREIISKSSYIEPKDDITSTTTRMKFKNTINLRFPLSYESSATKGNIYHASKIPLTQGLFIAAQGPSANTQDDFIAVLAEAEAYASVSLVHDDNFQNKNKNQKLWFGGVGTKYIIPEDIDLTTGKIIRDQHTIYHLDTQKYNDLAYDLFIINGKPHLRIYDTSWLNDTSGKLNRATAIIVFLEKIRQSTFFKDRENMPVVVNCNSGVGRAGTFISLMDAIRAYLKQEELADPVERIMHARKYRYCFVYSYKQLNGIIKFTENPQLYIEPALSALY